MNPSDAINAVSAQAQSQALAGQSLTPSADPASAPQLNFGDMITRGMAEVENKVHTADQLVRQFAVDDSIPVHQVTIALEEARLAVEMALQVRTRLVEAYRELMNMQL